MNKMKVLMAAATALALSACGGSDDGSGGGGAPVIGQNGAVDVKTVSMPAGQTCGIGNFAPALLAAINSARAQARNCGGQAYAAAPAILYWNTLISQAAVTHSADMASKNFFSHTGSDGSTPYDRLIAAGYHDGGGGEILSHSWGTNASSNRISPAAVEGWFKSPAHCASIMEASFDEIGAACVQSGNKAYLTVDFG